MLDTLKFEILNCHNCTKGKLCSVHRAKAIEANLSKADEKIIKGAKALTEKLKS